MPYIYFLIDKLDFEIILKTCNKTEIPPNPSKKAHIIIVVEIFFVAVAVTSDIPFVSSIIPETTGFTKLKSIFNNLKIKDKKTEKASNILLVFKIDIITEKITTNPPIIIKVLLDSRIDSERIVPKFLKLQVRVFCDE